MSAKCPVCERIIKADHPQKGDRLYEEDYCSHYCRLFDSQNLKKVVKSRSKHHAGMFKWPEIHIPCEMCAEPTLIIHDIEKCNRQFCSTTCYHKLLGGKKRGMVAAYLLLSLLKHRATYYPTKSELSCDELAAYTTRGFKRMNGSRVASMLKRWVASGIITIRRHRRTRRMIVNPTNRATEYVGVGVKSTYKFNLEKLQDTPLARFMLDWVTMSYSERVALSQSLNT